nr:MAG TPA: hypothetical protein [Caudoviricetes sp.]
MIASLTAIAAAIAVGLPIFALGERIRDSRDADRHASTACKETTP